MIMTNESDTFRMFHESLGYLKGQFQVLDTNVPVEQQMAYFRYSERVRKNKNNPSIEDAIDILNDWNTSEDEKRYLMTVLAISGDVKAYRVLETYSLYPEESLKDWVGLALLQAKMTLESEFSDERRIFISTGLGGKGDMLRFYAFFKSKNLQTFSPYQIQLIEKEILFSVKEAQGIVEELRISENYFYLIFLINIKADIKNTLENAIIECNQYGDFIDRSFIITNVKTFDEEDIKKELEDKNCI